MLALATPARAERIVWEEGQERACAPGRRHREEARAWQREAILTKLEMKAIVRIDASELLRDVELLVK